jgi:hypothetical protein
LLILCKIRYISFVGINHEEIMSVKFTLYVCELEDILAGLALVDNIYNLPKEWIEYQIEKRSQLSIRLNIDLRIEFDPDAIRGTDLESLFSTKSTASITAVDSVKTSDFAKPWLDLLKSEHNPFKWRLDRASYRQLGVAENAVGLAIKAMDYWQQAKLITEHKKEFQALEGKKCSLENQIEREVHELEYMKIYPTPVIFQDGSDSDGVYHYGGHDYEIPDDED